MSEPDHVFQGLRQEGSIAGLCYCTRVKMRHTIGPDGLPAAVRSKYDETYAVFIDDERNIFDAYVIPEEAYR